MLAYPDKAYQVKQLKQLMQDCYIVEHSANVLEFTAKACDKGTAVAYICENGESHWMILYVLGMEPMM